MNLSPVFRQRFFDANGVPLAGGQLYSYAAGTTTPQVTYSNESGTTNTNPVVLDSSGYADVWLDPTLSYKFELQDASDNVLWTVDNVSYDIGITTWSTNTTYAQGAIVADSSGYGLFYVSLVNNNQGNALTDVSAWRVLAGNVRTLSSNTTLLVTDDLVRSNTTSAALTHTLPACASTPTGKRITIKDVGTGGYTTTVQGSGNDKIDGNNVYVVALKQYSVITVVNNGSSWDVVSEVSIGNAAVGSTSSGTFVTSSNSWTNVTNGSGTAVTVAITGSGNPIVVGIQSDASGGLEIAGTTSGGSIQILRGSTPVAIFNVPNGVITVPGPVLDTPGAGTFTYTLQAIALTSSSVEVEYCKLFAYEI